MRGDFIREKLILREITPEHPLGPDDDPDHVWFTQGKWLLVGEPDRYLNHSCDPNAWLRYKGARIELVARRAIAPGEEITLDYLINNEGGNSWPCNCGAVRCRGETGISFFTLPIGFQREYLPLLAPWFVKRYARELAHLDASERLDPPAGSSES